MQRVSLLKARTARPNKKRKVIVFSWLIAYFFTQNKPGLPRAANLSPFGGIWAASILTLVKNR